VDPKPDMVECMAKSGKRTVLFSSFGNPRGEGVLGLG
jgi:hypothetical protein